MVIFGIIVGAIAGVVWAFALGTFPASGAKVGAIIGGILGILLALYNSNLTNSGRASMDGARINSITILLSILSISIALSIVVGILRWIF